MKSAKAGGKASIANEASLGEGLSRAEALRRPEFYLVFFGIMIGSISLISTLVHGVPMLLERENPIELATSVISLAFAGVVVGELSAGFLVDKINTPKIILPYFALAFAGLSTPIHRVNSCSPAGRCWVWDWAAKLASTPILCRAISA